MKKLIEYEKKIYEKIKITCCSVLFSDVLSDRVLRNRLKVSRREITTLSDRQTRCELTEDSIVFPGQNRETTGSPV